MSTKHVAEVNDKERVIVYADDEYLTIIAERCTLRGRTKVWYGGDGASFPIDNARDVIEAIQKVVALAKAEAR